MPATIRPTARSAFNITQSAVGAADPTRSVVDCILANANRCPERTALVLAGRHAQRAVSYREFGGLIVERTAGLERNEIPAGSRVLIMAQPSLEFYALALAVLASGRILVVVDGRMRRRRIVHALRSAAPNAVVATPSAMRWWPLLAPLRNARRFTIDGSVFGTTPIEKLRIPRARLAGSAPSADAAAIIAFSSGSTGDAKQIYRSHRVLLAQHRALATAFPPPVGDVNLPGFPMAVLHNLCCGTTSVLPDSELRAAIAADVGEVLHLVDRCGITSLSAAPALARAIARRALSTGRVLAAVDHVVVGGGPVSRTLCAEVIAAFPNANASAIYGATEAEPIATVSMSEMLASDGDGFLVGKPVVEIETFIDNPNEGAGEILVRGAHVVPPGGVPNAWHRTSDVGRLDEQGRLWLLGRVGEEVRHRGRLVYPLVVEACARAVRGVAAAGFVAHARAPDGELAIEIDVGVASATEVVTRVGAALADHGLDSVPVRVVARIPMDARHQSKVARVELARLLARSAR